VYCVWPARLQIKQAKHGTAFGFPPLWPLSFQSLGLEPRQASRNREPGPSSKKYDQNENPKTSKTHLKKKETLKVKLLSRECVTSLALRFFFFLDATVAGAHWPDSDPCWIFLALEVALVGSRLHLNQPRLFFLQPILFNSGTKMAVLRTCAAPALAALPRCRPVRSTTTLSPMMALRTPAQAAPRAGEFARGSTVQLQRLPQIGKTLLSVLQRRRWRFFSASETTIVLVSARGF